MKKNFSDFKKFINNKNIAVVGMGVSNRPLIDFLTRLGGRVTGFDKKTQDEFGSLVNEYKNKGVKVELGKDYLDKLVGFEVIFKTPSMRIDSSALIKAKLAGAYITSEMEEFVRYCPAKIFGITGSDGKTTTTTLIADMIKEEGYKTWVGGNIGTPLFTNIEEISEKDMVVLELSSFQLMTMKVSIDVAIITNLSPNHLDMHKGMDEYISSKKNIFKYQGENGIVILNKDNKITNSIDKEIKGKVLKFTTKEKLENGAYYEDDKLFVNNKYVCSKEDIQVKGMHNVENFLAAFCAVYEDVSIASMKRVATTFKGVEHRCEFVRELDGVKYYNDSIATSPTRAIASITSFEKPVILIAGGYDKNIPFEPLAENGYDKIKALILFGATKYKIREVFENTLKQRKAGIPIFITDSFEEAIYEAKKNSIEGDIITLSPACASFDMFDNFEIRGNKFKEIVLSIE